MHIARRLRRLLKKKGYRVTDAVREGLSDFSAIILEQNPDRIDPETRGEDDEDGAGAAEDLAQTRAITCPHCGEQIDIAIDLSGEDQDSIQDCSVCCSPIRVTYGVRNGRLGAFAAEPC